MLTIEQYIEGKYQTRVLCEDGIFVGENIAAVVDGVTSDNGILFENKSSGAFAKDTIIEALQSNNNLYSYSAEDAFVYLSDYLSHRVFESIRMDECDFGILPRASVIIYNSNCNQVWGYGDCQCIVDGVLYKHDKRIDVINSEIRAEQISAAINNGASLEELSKIDIGRAAISDRIKEQIKFENEPGEYGYPVINGKVVCREMISIIPVESNLPVVLASDGYPYLCDTLAESEERLAAMLLDDPLCYRLYKSTKGKMQGMVSYDDRAYWKGK